MMPAEPGEAYRDLGYGAPATDAPRSIGDWRVYRSEHPTLHAASQKQARELAELAQPAGYIEIEHLPSRELWARQGGTWRRVR